MQEIWVLILALPLIGARHLMPLGFSFLQKEVDIMILRPLSVIIICDKHNSHATGPFLLAYKKKQDVKILMKHISKEL